MAVGPCIGATAPALITGVGNFARHSVQNFTLFIFGFVFLLTGTTRISHFKRMMIFKNDDVSIYSEYLLSTNITSLCVHQFGFARKRGRLLLNAILVVSDHHISLLRNNKLKKII